MSKKDKPGPGKESTQFKPGQRGGGGPKKYTMALVRGLAREQSGLAIQTLAEVCMESDSDSARVAASNAILDRAWGKAPQKLDVDAKITNEELMARLREMAREML